MKLGTCYQDAYKLLELLPDGWWLCHATVTGRGPIEGIRHGHAWVEKGQCVLDGGKAVDRELYYKIGEVRNVRRFTLKQAHMLAFDTGHYGPWKGQGNYKIHRKLTRID